MVWTQALEIVPGVTAVIGGGGKTTLLRTLGGELAAAGHAVLLCTTTKIFPFPGIPSFGILFSLSPFIHISRRFMPPDDT